MLTQVTINNLKEKYGDIYYVSMLGYEFVWRLLSRKEFQWIDSIPEEEMSEEEKEDMVCEMCILYPTSFTFDDKPAGIVTTLATFIISESGFYPEEANQMLEQHRHEMNNIEFQMEAIVIMAFPTLKIEDIEQWPTSKLLKYFTRAEWILTNLQGVPVSEIIKNLHTEGLIEGDPSDFPELAEFEKG